VLTMPFLPMGDFDKDAKIRHAVYDHPIVKGQLAKWNAMLYVTSNLPQYEFLGKGKAPVNLSDFKGMRVRAGGGVGKAMEKLGAIRQTVPASEVYTLISRGAVDAVSFPFTYAHGAYKIHEVAEWYTANLSPGTSDCPYAINKKSYDKLPKQYQDLLAKLRPEALNAMKVAYKKADEKYLPMFKSKLKEVKYDEKTLAEFRKTAGKPVWDAWVAANKDKFDAQALIDLVFETAK
jgi:TRAP-type C4-dicarboxylate transport system substrate-binding protein